MLLRLFICISIALLAGCSSNYKHSEKPATNTTAKTDTQEYLDPALGVLVFTPVDAQFEHKPQEKSAYLTADAVRKAFAKHAKRAGTAYKCIDDECLKRLNPEKFGYYVKLKVLHWENQPNEWPSERDRIEIVIMVFDATSHKELAWSSFKGESSWPVIAIPRPQHLLTEPIAEFIATLYEEELEEPVEIKKPSRLI